MSTDFFSERVRRHLQLRLNLDQFLGRRRVGEVLLGQLAQDRTAASPMNFDQVLLGRRQSF